MNYVETVEEYGHLNELQSDLNLIINRFREIGNLDVELSVDFLTLTITVIAPEEDNDL